MKSCKSEEEDKITALDAGADDYVVKPFSPPEVLARIKAILRRGPLVAAANYIKVAGIILDDKNHRVTIDGGVIKMGPLEFRLLHFFMTHQNRVFTREQLLNHVWKNDALVEPRTVDVHVRRLRKVLNTNNQKDYIRTVRSAGYSFGHN